MRKRKNQTETIRAYKNLLKADRDWDYGFLLELERKKLQRMAKYFSESEIAESDAATARELTLCVRLLDIILDKERFRDAWSDDVSKHHRVLTEKNADGKTYTLNFEYTGMIPDFPKYVNLRNAHRFMPPASFPKPQYSSPEEEKYRHEHFKEDVRNAKAWHLYHLIREYRMFGGDCPKTI